MILSSCLFCAFFSFLKVIQGYQMLTAIKIHCAYIKKDVVL